MKDSDLKMPSFRATAAALYDTTERFAREISAPCDCPPAWNDLNWAVAQAAAAIQGISVLLASRLKWTGPASWESFLSNQVKHSVLREEKIKALLKRIDAVFSDAKLNAIALKGSSVLRLDLYNSGERPMSDIDLLVRPEQLDSVKRVLGELGYHPGFTNQRHIEFAPPGRFDTHSFGEHEKNAIPIEVHTIVQEPLPVKIVDITESIWPGMPDVGAGAYRSNASLMLHLLLHTAAGIRQRAVRLIQLHDIALLATKLDLDDWRWITSALCREDSRWWLYPPLAVTDQYFPNTIPATVIQDSARLCPVLLRSVARRYEISRVSYSNPRIPAFPGLSWSGTPMEAFQLVSSRVFPGRNVLDELHEATGTNPRLLKLPWYGISQSERILRWVTGRAPRVQTMLSVHEALDGTIENRP